MQCCTLLVLSAANRVHGLVAPPDVLYSGELVVLGSLRIYLFCFYCALWTKLLSKNVFPVAVDIFHSIGQDTWSISP